MRISRKPEHEWLRLAAMVKPDWEAMRALTEESPMYGMHARFDWREIIREGGLAHSHQLLGVACWRYLAPDLDGVCPEDAREEAQRKGAELDTAGAEYVARAEVALEPLRQSGIPFAAASSLAVYALYGGGRWPRRANDLDICVPARYWREVRDAYAGKISADGIPYTETFSVGVPRAGEHDEFLEVVTHPPGHDHMVEGIYGDEGMFRAPREVSLAGITLPVPRPEAWLVMQAQRLMEQCEFRGGPLTLGMLARLAAIGSLPDLQWDQVLRLLKHFRAKTERRIACGRTRSDLPPEEMPEVIGRGDTPDAVQWALRLAGRAYRFVPQSFWDGLAQFVDSDRPLQVTAWVGPAINGEVDVKNGYATFVDVAPIPDLERLIFSQYDVRTYAERLAAGVWLQQSHEVRVRLDQRPWSVQAGAQPDTVGPACAT